MAKNTVKSSGAGESKPKREVSSANLIPVPKNSRKGRKRIGQGPGSGMGKTSTRGQKGQKARASSMRPGFEGGQMRIALRMPKRGFTNIFKEVYQAVNFTIIDRKGLTGLITPEILEANGIIKDATAKVKILGTGELKSPVQITADAISKSAEDKLKKIGGSFQLREAKSTKAE
ncbi:MAG: 50S ribosomal protein L15 [Leptospiraceae bacterium]|nr:50S ribosomal protein L15 [Leptospiraceae bacterium]